MILGIDCAHEICSVALVKDGKLLSEFKQNMPRGQAEALFPIINGMLKDNNVSYKDIDKVVVCVGPGSFTGVRVAISSANGIGLAANIDVVGVSILECLGDKTKDNAVVLLDTKRQDYYCAEFKDGKMVNEGFVANDEDVERYRQKGYKFYGNADVEDIINTVMPTASDMIEFINKYPEKQVAPVPLYMRPAEVSLPCQK
ncbi:MAG: tRNA (adenosine(37)-N6)-threonylcarbamoyltransferase complex dimerization subunit type 1 TsaB [Alphaproteobacteria bacterium]|nr:tRNA (adenosine(37)-N6)-threonylcarbamoyltransferase complex dimerization subunit type 1 TsaB [Alphaproteobacteria bacterium]